jgi:hypothetical protein
MERMKTLSFLTTCTFISVAKKVSGSCFTVIMRCGTHQWLLVHPCSLGSLLALSCLLAWLSPHFLLDFLLTSCSWVSIHFYLLLVLCSPVFSVHCIC